MLVNPPVRVSVVTIFFNADLYLEEAIQSVLAQTYAAWELILANDGSTDGSATIARQYAQNYPDRIRYLAHPDRENRGMSATRNLGIAAARGEFIAFLDADDVWLAEKLQRQVELLDGQPSAAMVYGPTLLWYSWTGNPDDASGDRLRYLGVNPNQLIEPPDLIERFLRRQALPPSTCGILVRRSAVERVGRFEESFRGMYEDQAFLYKICLTEPVFVTDQCWDKYRQHSASFSALAELAGVYDANRPNRAHLVFLTWFQEYVARTELEDRRIQDALRAAFWPYHHPRLARLLYRAGSIRAKLARVIRRTP